MRVYFIISLFIQTILFSLIIVDFSKKNLLWPWGKQNVQDTRPIQSKKSLADHLAKIKSYEDSSNLLNNADITKIKRFSIEEQNQKQKIITAIKLHFPGNDNILDLINFKSDEFKKSYLRKKLNELQNIKIYTVVEFQKPITFKSLSTMRKMGFSPIKILPSNQYLHKKIAFFYVNYPRIFLMSKRHKMIKNIYIISHFTATGLYQLDVRSLEEKENVSINIRLPYSKTGRELIYKKNNLVGTDDINEQLTDDYGSQTTLDLKRNQTISFFSEIRYKIDLLANIESHIKIQGKKVYLKDYKKTMIEKHPDIYHKFTKYSEKIMPSEYIYSIVNRIDKQKPLNKIWNQIDQILDYDIKYDWKKRDLFFSGNLTYTNIKDMYMTANELGIKKRGACPERTSLEISILRELGIAARSATRLYHIYTEIFIPDYGWSTTSLTLNEIPLTKSFDETMAYFVYWTPNHPIRLKWGGYIYPSIIY